MRLCKRKLHMFDGKQCLPCRRASAKAWKVSNAERVKAYKREYAARLSDELKAKNVERATRWAKANPQRKREYLRQWYLLNRESDLAKKRARRRLNPHRDREASAAWGKANPERKRQHAKAYLARRRVRLKNGTVEPVTNQFLDMLLIQQDFRCFYCSCQLANDKHLDHIVPVSRGGAHATWNLCYACPSCNRRKNAMTAEEFMAQESVA